MSKTVNRIPEVELFKQLTKIATLLGYKIIYKVLPKDTGGLNTGKLFKSIVLPADQHTEYKMYALTHEILHILLPKEDLLCDDFAEIVVYMATYGVLLSWGYDYIETAQRGIALHSLKLFENTEIFYKSNKQIPSREMLYYMIRLAVSMLATAGGMLTEKSLIVDIGNSVDALLDIMPERVQNIWQK